ncbi:MAG: biotin--[acetyl-CoA-carboxylase] ligase [Halocynthiibacter sp.]
MSNNTHWPQGVGRILLDEVDSTNAEAARISSSLSGPTWIVAKKQTQGRGRRGRAWADPKGNFAGSLVMRPTESPDQISLRSFVASLALYDTLVDLRGRADGLALKWPNDVLLNGGKIAGILLESAGQGTSISHFCIGIGVNLRETPNAQALEATAHPPASLEGDTGIVVSAEEFLDHLAPNYARYEAQFTTYGFDAIRSAWIARAAKIGETITARTMRDEMVGRFETVDAQGNLVLEAAGQRHIIPAADVFF